jgi:flagellar biosynthesis protein FliP
MTFAGYAGMLGTLAFVLGLVLLAARLLKRFLPGTSGHAGLHGFSVVQRIPLGQRQSVAIVQRGETLIGLSVGDGGVRMLFTLPENDAAAPAMARELSTLIPAPADNRRALLDRQVTPTVPLIVDLPARNSALVDTRIAARSATPAIAAPVSSAMPRNGDLFRSALRVAMRSSTVLSWLVLAQTQAIAQAPAAPPTPRPASVPAPQQPVAAPAPTRGASTLRTLPPAAAQPGPRDRAPRAELQVPAPRPATPTTTPSRGGGVAEFAPLVPATQARAIVAAKQRGVGNTPLTTPEAARMAERADSMLTRLAPHLDLTLGGGAATGEELRLSGTVGVVVMMGLLSLLPMLLLMMTGFTRILIVLHFLKQALGTQTTPPGQLVAAMALLLSGFVMAPTLTEVHSTALTPWMDGQIEQVEMMQRAVVPFKGFMLRQVRDQDLQTFVDLADAPEPATREDVALPVLMSAFVTSELRTAFQIGFALFLPFIVIDVVVGSVLMSMGMVMLPPALISMPFKLLLFVLVDGWGLVITGLVQSFR